MKVSSQSIKPLTKKQNEEQLSNLFMQAPVGFSLARGKNHVIELANKEFLRLTGRDMSIIGKPIIEIFTEIETQGYLILLNRVLKNKETINLKESPAVILIDGKRETLFINTILQPYFDGDDAVGVLSILTDVTEQVLVRKRIEENEERLRLATETTKLGTWEFLPLTGQLTWSDECKRIYEFPLDKEVDYALFAEHIYHEDKIFALGAIEKAMDPNGTGEYDIEYRILRYTDKNVRWIRAQGKVFFNTDKNPLRFIGTVLDITDAKAEEEIVRVNEERLRLAVESGRLGTYELDIPNSSIIYSPRLAALFGLDPSKKRTHQDLKNAIHPDDMHIRNDAHEAAKKSGSLFYEARVVWPDESIHWIRLNGTVVFDKNGKALRTYGTALDITEEKETERILKESEEKFRTLANSISQLAWMAQPDGWIYWYNQRWYEYTGSTLESMQGWGWQKLHHPDHIDRILNFVKEAWQNNKPFELTFPLKRNDGVYRWFLTRVYPIINADGKVIQWIGTNTDIDDQKKTLEQKDEFISIASHELKTPVTSLKGFTQILKLKFEKEENPQAVDLLSRMDKQVDKLTKLIVELLDATKIENGQLKFSKEDFDFNALVLETAEEMQRTTQKHTIKVELAPTKIICGDKDRIGQVIINLVSNAIKYSPNANEILITSSIENNSIKLCVRDFGIGIPEEKQANVFDRFFRVSGDKQDTFPGLGLGLFISSEIIKRHEGNLTVKSIPGEGATFCFILPLTAHQ